MIRNGIVIAVYGQSNHLPTCLESLKMNTLIPYDLLVIDTKSPRISLAKAWNRAISMLNSEIITVLNDDTIVGKNWLELQTQTLLSKGNIGLVSPTVSKCGNKWQVKPFELLSNKNVESFSVNDASELSEKIYAEYHGKTKECGHDISGACMTFRKETWKDVNGFDERFFPAYGEDSDFFDKLLFKGLKLVWDMQSYVHHFGGQTAKIVPDLNRKFTSDLYWKKLKERQRICR